MLSGILIFLLLNVLVVINVIKRIDVFSEKIELELKKYEEDNVLLIENKTPKMNLLSGTKVFKIFD